MDQLLTCEYCHLVFKNIITLKCHMINSKKCMKIRGVTIETKYQCKGCDEFFVNKANLNIHQESCKKYNIMQATQELQKKINELELKQTDLLLENNLIKNKNIQLEEEKQTLKILNNKNELIVKEKDNIILLQQKNADKALVDAHQQIETLQKMLEGIATKAVDKPTTTTNNTTINQIRNSFYDKYFIEDLLESDIKRKCQSVLTEQVLLEGQRGIARMCTEYFINTKDQKKLLIATDPSRNKFKYMDKHGNMKDDIEARTFIEKVSKPIKEVAGYIFDGVLSDIKDEQENIEEDNYSRKAYLHDKEMQANHSLVYIKCFDDPKHNSEFTNELAILNKNK